MQNLCLSFVSSEPISFLFFAYFFDIFPTLLGNLMQRSCIIQWTQISFIKRICIVFAENMHILLVWITHSLLVQLAVFALCVRLLSHWGIARTGDRNCTLVHDDPKGLGVDFNRESIYKLQSQVIIHTL